MCGGKKTSGLIFLAPANHKGFICQTAVVSQLLFRATKARKSTHKLTASVYPNVRPFFFRVKASCESFACREHAAGGNSGWLITSYSNLESGIKS